MAVEEHKPICVWIGSLAPDFQIHLFKLWDDGAPIVLYFSEAARRFAERATPLWITQQCDHLSRERHRACRQSQHRGPDAIRFLQRRAMSKRSLCPSPSPQALSGACRSPFAAARCTPPRRRRKGRVSGTQPVTSTPCRLPKRDDARRGLLPHDDHMRERDFSTDARQDLVTEPHHRVNIRPEIHLAGKDHR